jgi:acetyl esterase/lipase
MIKCHFLVLLVVTLVAFDFAPRESIVDTHRDSTQVDYDVETYKTVNNHSLKALIYRSRDIETNKKHPAFIFVHGGGWEIGEPEWGRDICRRYSSLGFVSISFEYRLEGKHKANALDAIADVKSAIRWTREHANDLNINPDRIVAYGFSAGGHLAACTAMVSGFDDPNDNHKFSCIPNVLIVKSAPIIIFEDNSHFSRIEDLSSVKDCSPIEHIRADLPPTLIIHGSLDPYTPLWSIKEFEKRMKRFNNRCELHIYDGIKHHNWDSVDEEVFEVMDKFLISLGYMEDK